MGNTVLTMGSFDMIHAGHISLLLACKKLAGPDGRVIVGVNSDEFMTEYKRPPIIPFLERQFIISTLPYVDLVYTIREHNASKLIDELQPTFLVIGEDWAHKDYFTQIGTSKEDLKRIGATLIYKSIDWERTTTQTIQDIVERFKESQ